MNGYYFNDNNEFVIEDYLSAKPFSSFLPGIAGEKGIPMWSFYVNRGQGVSSFGIQDKNNPIMEFYPANGAYQYVGTYGFRTFIKIDGDIYEPFKEETATSAKMIVRKDRFIIEEINKDLGLKVQVIYSTLSNMDFGGLIRKVTVENLTDEDINIEIIDGMPALLPYGVENQSYKEMSNLMRSWMEVSHRDDLVPYYKLRSSTKDEAVVSEVQSGYYFMNEKINNQDVFTIYDPSLVFGHRTDLLKAVGFEKADLDELKQKEQVFANKVPCAFQGAKLDIKANSYEVINSIIGFSHSYEEVESFVANALLKDFVNEQILTTEHEINQICSDVETETSDTAFNNYIKQSYLDNVLRGGKPVFFDTKEGKHVYHIFSRKHGDPERDYNFFSLEPSMFSRGNGNYRDVCQNRRNDVIIEPEVADFNLWMFYSLVQADGYNPLSIKGMKYKLKDTDDLQASLAELDLEESVIKAVLNAVSGDFTPGQLAMAIINHSDITKDNEAFDKIIGKVMYQADAELDVAFGEGFWSDHFTYNLDLINSYEYMYPDQIMDTLLNKFDYPYYNAPYYVVPRAKKYNLVEEGKIRQYEAIEKKENHTGDWMEDPSGKSVKTNLFNKMLTLSMTKFLNLDPYALGIEMEGDKPGWNDALNGLPGLFGSGMSETIETKRTIDFLINKTAPKSVPDTKMNKCNNSVPGTKMNKCNKLVPDTIKLLNDNNALMSDILDLINKVDINALHKDSKNSFNLWDNLNRIKEDYRAKTKETISSEYAQVSTDTIIEALTKMSEILGAGIDRAIEIGGGLLPSYFINEVTEYELNNTKTLYGLESVKPLAFNNRPLPFFLEAPARYLKTLNRKQGDLVVDKIKETGIYDSKLNMFKTSESIESETMEIGRIRAFTPGWLERESVFLHMTYKMLLSLLDAGLYDRFYEEIKTNMIPMLDPAVYGRATTENSSFIASDVNPDPSLIGQGFVARLSGSTAEIISMWIKMFIGNEGFTMKGEQLTFNFNPVLTADMFKEGKVSYTLFGHTKVTYINETGRSTFGKNPAAIVKIVLDGKEVPAIESELAEKLRNKEVSEIKVYFA